MRALAGAVRPQRVGDLGAGGLAAAAGHRGEHPGAGAADVGKLAADQKPEAAEQAQLDRLVPAGDRRRGGGNPGRQGDHLGVPLADRPGWLHPPRGLRAVGGPLGRNRCC